MKAYLESFQIFTPEQIEEALSYAQLRHLAKGEFLIREGSISREVAFLQSGILRSFYHNHDSEEVTYCFPYPRTFVTAYSSFISGGPSNENIQAISEVELLVIPKTKVDEIVERDISWLRFMKIIAEEQYMDLERRIFLLQREKAEKRYADLLENRPEYILQIPLQYVASYLGITPRHLSRLRKDLVNKS